MDHRRSLQPFDCRWHSITCHYGNGPHLVPLTPPRSSTVMADAASANSRSNVSDILNFVCATRILTHCFYCHPHHAVHLFFGLRTESPQNGNSPDIRQRLSGVRGTKVRELVIRRLATCDETAIGAHFLRLEKKFSKLRNGWLE